MKSFVLESHPRTFVHSNNIGLMVVALLLSVMAILSTVGTTRGILYKKQNDTLDKAKSNTDRVFALSNRWSFHGIGWFPLDGT